MLMRSNRLEISTSAVLQRSSRAGLPRAVILIAAKPGDDDRHGAAMSDRHEHKAPVNHVHGAR
eukprot:COSAG01_NODE_281_length_19504_cov_129.173124_23_plen_63_part_00